MNFDEMKSLDSPGSDKPRGSVYTKVLHVSKFADLFLKHFDISSILGITAVAFIAFPSRNLHLEGTCRIL